MSSELLIFLLKGSLVWTVLYSLFWLFFRKNGFHQLNRLILLAILFCSLGFPLFQIEYEYMEAAVPAFAEETLEIIKPLPVGGEEEGSGNEEHFLWQIGLGIYFLGVAIAIFRFAMKFRALLALTEHATPARAGDRRVFETTHKLAPFSFFRHIYVPKGIDREQLQIVLIHEEAHVKQQHTLDILLLEMYAIIFWFNPLLSWFRKTLQELHEFLADKEVLEKGIPLSTYLNLLKNNVHRAYQVQLAQAFFQSTIINRIHMMTSAKSPAWKRGTYLLFLPVLASFMLAFTSPPSPPELNEEVVPNIKPIAEAQYRYISSGYGMRKNPWTKEMMMHTGVDFAADKGTDVRATADGVVIEVSYKKEGEGYGRKIIVQHNDTYSTLYSQLSAFNVKEGNTVKQGDIIGFVGSSGKSTGPHLHYEVWKNGEKVNPEDYF
ncbi:MAG: M23/M56 family metallopeptidase [Bacteroidota bacterium]